MLVARPWLRVAQVVVAAPLVAAGLLIASAAFIYEPVAADSSLTAAVTPAQISLIPGASALVVLAITNPTSATATVVQVTTVLSDASVSVQGASTNPSAAITIPGSSSTALTYTVTRAKEATAQDVAVTFLASYTGGAVSGSQPAIAVAGLSVKAGASPAVVQAAIQSNVTNINENRPGEAALVVTNPREARIDVNSIEVTAPSFVDVTVMCGSAKPLTTSGGTTHQYSGTDCPLAVDARSQAVARIGLSTTDTITPGPRTLVVKVTATDSDNGVTSSSVATLQFTVDVFAETDLVKALGVPIFLLLPGVLMVVTGWFLVQNLTPWRNVLLNVELPQTGTALTSTTILGLALSLALALAYPYLTAHVYPGHPRDYLKAYGFRDFYYVFGYSFAIAAAVWVIAWIASLSRWFFLPAAHEQPRALLRKIALTGMFRGTTQYDQAKVGDQVKGLHLGNRGGDKVLVTPKINVSVAANDEALKAKIEKYAASSNPLDAIRLWRTIRSGTKHGAVTNLSYKSGGDVTEPKLIDAANVSKGQESPLVDVVNQ